jgi:hypothetical protein
MQRQVMASVFSRRTNITETIVFAGQKHTKALSEGVFDAADYRCGSTKLSTNFDLSEGGPFVHDFVAIFKRL